MTKPTTARTCIVEAFLQLCQTLPCDKITVSQLTKKAGYNRSTFYAYFNNTDDLLKQLENELFEKELYSFRDEYLELLQSKYNEFIEDYPYEFGNYDVVFLNEPNLKAVVRTLKTNYIDLKIKMWIGGGSGYDCGNGFGNFSFYVFREAGISAEILKRKPFRIVGFSDKKEI